jgi:hypothetical protein
MGGQNFGETVTAQSGEFTPLPRPGGGAPPASQGENAQRYGQQMEGVQKADEQAFRQEQSALAKPMSALAGMPAPPPVPQTQKAPPAPDAQAYRKDAMAWASAMAVLGAVAGRFARVPGTAALSAFGGALKGWQEGNQQAYEDAAKKWEENNKAVVENNRQVLEKYKLALENRKMNIDEQMSQIQLISAQYHDKIMYDAAAAKNYTMVAQIYEKQFQYTDKVKQAGDKLIEKRRADDLKSQENASYWMMTEEGQAKLPTLSAGQQASIKQAWERLGQKGMGKSAIAQDRQQYINEYTDEHGVAPTSSQITDWEAERSGKTAEATTVGRRAGGIAIAVDEAHQTIPNVLAAAEKSAGRGLATWNRIENKWNVEKGDADFAFYVQQMNSLINVYGRVISGGGKGTVSDLEHAREMLNPNMPLSAVKGSLRGFSTEVDIAEKAPGRVRSKMRGDDQSGAGAGATDTPAGNDGWKIEKVQ